jgi:hypothetical protein
MKHSFPITPGLIRFHDTPLYLGMNRRRFNTEVQPYLAKNRIGKQGMPSTGLNWSPESNNIRLAKDVPVGLQEVYYGAYSDINEQARALVKHTLCPWMVPIEQAMNISLLSEDVRQAYFIEHDAEGLLGGSLKERLEAYRTCKKWSWLNWKEISSNENIGSLGPAGDTYRQPMNSELLGPGNTA